MSKKRLDREKKKRPKEINGLGRFLMKLPPWPILYPLYLANQLDLEEELYWSPRLPLEFDGLRIVFLSDIHYGPLYSEERVRDLAERVNALHADIVILGGDYGVNSFGALEFFALKPHFQANIAVLAVLGNHDRMLPEENKEKILAAMREDGITPLLNDGVLLEREGHRLAITGVDDYYCGEPDCSRIADMGRYADFSIFVSHMPDLLPDTFEMPGRLFYHLALCGHTHGGQVTVAGHALFSSSLYGDRFLSGWYNEQGADILVSNGVGVSGLPVRLGARPQYHLITLKREE